jgi:uncharacterized protein
LDNKTAILFFSRSAQAEAKYKKLLNHNSFNKKVYNGLIKATLHTITQTNLPYFLIDETLQVGNNFAERMHNAAEIVIAKGYEKIIIIGNDCPQISKDILLNASKQLLQNKCVVGGTQHGGIYLLGITKNTFSLTDFETINWQTNSVFKEVVAHFNNVYLLPTLQEISFLRDLKLFAAKFYCHSKLAAYFKNITASLQLYFLHNRYYFKLSKQLKLCYSNLPPPVL